MVALTIVSNVFIKDLDDDKITVEKLVEYCIDDFPSPSTLQQELHLMKLKIQP